MVDRSDQDAWLWKVGQVGKVDWIGHFGLVRGFDRARWSWEVEWFGLVKEFDWVGWLGWIGRFDQAKEFDWMGWIGWIGSLEQDGLGFGLSLYTMYFGCRLVDY